MFNFKQTFTIGLTHGHLSESFSAGIFPVVQKKVIPVVKCKILLGKLLVHDVEKVEFIGEVVLHYVDILGTVAENIHV